MELLWDIILRLQFKVSIITNLLLLPQGHPNQCRITIRSLHPHQTIHSQSSQIPATALPPSSLIFTTLLSTPSLLSLDSCVLIHQIDIIFYILFVIKILMSNPFQAFNISDDEETFQPAAEQKVKRTHQEKKAYKQQKEQEAAKAASTPAPVITESLPEKVKENAKVVRHNNATPSYKAKELGEGHYRDRQSGTGRPDRPRKEGGGWGNVGNLKDEFKKDKYIKESPVKTRPEGEEAPAAEGEAPAVVDPVVEQKPVEPEAPTLEEYYKSKGVEITNNYEKKAPVRKADLNAEWIKKEKLVLLESKEDKKISERNAQNIVKFSSSRVGLDENLESLGFFSKAEKKPEYKQENKHEGKHEYRGKGKRPVVNDDDFPSL